jgi:hypothetical protein
MADVHLASLPRLLPCTTTTTQPQSSQSRRPIMATSTNAALANLQPRQTHRSRSISSSTNSTPRISTSNRSTPYLRPSPTSRRRNRHLLPRQPTLSRQTSPALDTLIDSLEQSRLNSRTRQRARSFPPRPPTAATPAITLTSTDITATTIKPTIKSKDKMASTSTSMHAGPSSSRGEVRVKQEEGHVRVKQEEGCEASSSTQQQRQSQTQTQTQRIDERPRYKDPYHGHEEIAKMSARFVSIPAVFDYLQVVREAQPRLTDLVDHLAVQLSGDTSPDWTQQSSASFGTFHCREFWGTGLLFKST